MASKGGGKIKEKRTQLSSKPYQKHQSLFGKVKDTVKELLAPSWLSDFMSSVKQQPNSADIGEEEFMSPVQSPSEFESLQRKNVPVQQPFLPGNGISQSLKTDSVSFPAIRLEFPIATPSNSSADSTYPVKDNLPEKRHQPCSTIPQFSDKVAGKNMLSLADMTFHKDNVQFAPTAENCTQTLTSDNIQTQTKTVVLLKDKGLVQGPGPGYLPDRLERIRTWSANVTDSLSNVKTPAHHIQNKPAFNISLFGSPLNSTTLLTKSFHESSFYSGKTTFGGLSAHRKTMNTTLPYQTAFPTRRPMKARQLKPSVGAVTSSTAKRILDTLERMSTPLSDAKKIPDSSSSRHDSFLSFTPSTYRRQTRYSTGSSMNRSADFPSRGPPVNKLNTKSFASISKTRQPLPAFDGDLSFTKNATKRKSEQMTSKENLAKSDRVEMYDTSTVGGKMKREKSYHNPSRRAEDDVMIVPDLNTEFTLPVKDMPKFSFGSNIAPTTKLCNFSTVPEARFTFSSPATSNTEHSSSIALQSDYKFSTPIRLNEEPDEPVSKIPNTRNSIDSGMSFGIHNVSSRPELSSVLPQSVDGQKPEKQPTSVTGMSTNTDSNQNNPLHELPSGNVLTMVSGNGNSSSFQVPKPVIDQKNGDMVSVFNRISDCENNGSLSKGFKAAKDSVGGSVIDVLSKNQTDSLSLELRTASELKGGSVMDVLGKNKNDSLSLGFNTASKLKSGSVMDVLGGAKRTTDTSSGGLKAAQELKQGSVMDVLSKGAERSSKQNDLMAKFTSPVDSWTCDVCLVLNKADVPNCAACQTGKPGKAEFKSEFAPPVDSWTCDVCLISNKTDLDKCAACQTSKPASKLKFKKPEGEWNCDTCLVLNKSGSVQCIACETSRPGTQPPATGAFKLPSSAFSMPSGFTSKGFQFAATSSDDQQSTAFTSSIFCKQTSDSKSSDIPAVGFVFGKGEMDKKSDSASGVVFGQQEKSSESKTSDTVVSGFVFGKGETNMTSGSTLCLKFEQQESTKKSDNNKDKTSLGFAFGSQTEMKINSANSMSFSFGNKKNISEKPTSINPVVSEDDHVTNSNSIAVSKPEPISVVSSNCVVQTFSVPSATTPVPGELGFSIGQNPQPSSFQTPATGMSSTESSLKPQLSTFRTLDSKKPNFSFGASDSKTSLGDSFKPVFAESTADTSKAPFVFGQGGNIQTSNLVAPAVKGGFNFSSAAPRSQPVDTTSSNSGLFVFGGQSTNKDNKPLGAAPSVITTATPTFGIQPAKSSTTPVFGSTANPPAFGLPSSQSFRASATSTPGFSTTFGAQQATPAQIAPFGAAKATAEASTPFGVGSVAMTAVGSGNGMFGQSPFGTTPAPAFGSTSAPMFGGASAGGSGFGQNLTTPAFGATAPAPTLCGFGSSSGTASAFGGSSRNASAFGATSTSTASAFGAQTTSTGNPGFNFNSTTNFNFGAASNNTAQANIFQFGAQPTPGSTVPPVQPQQPATVSGGLNFGQAATTPGQGAFNFNATSTTVDQGPRKIKRAVRKIKR